MQEVLTADDFIVQVLDGNCSPGSEAKTVDILETIHSCTNGNATVEVVIDKSKISDADSSIYSYSAISYCVRFCFKLGDTVANYIDTPIIQDIDLLRIFTTENAEIGVLGYLK